MKNLLFSLLLLFTTCVQAQIADKAEDTSPLLVGEFLPSVILKNNKNADVSLQTVLSKKKTLLVFYRGGWCPFCNVQLAELAGAEPEIAQLGYQIVAVSAESFENIDATSEKDQVNYTVFSDPKGDFLQKMGIAFKMPKDYIGYISQKSKGQISELLPVPTVILVDVDGKILFEYINVDYRRRVSKDLLVAVMKTMK